MRDVQPVLVLVGFEHHVQPVGRVGFSPFGDEHQVFHVLGTHLRVAFLYVLHEGWVDFDNPPFAGLLLKDDERLSGEQVIPGQTQNVADAETEIDTAADQERNSEVPVLI